MSPPDNLNVLHELSILLGLHRQFAGYYITGTVLWQQQNGRNQVASTHTGNHWAMTSSKSSHVVTAHTLRHQCMQKILQGPATTVSCPSVSARSTPCVDCGCCLLVCASSPRIAQPQLLKYLFFTTGIPYLPCQARNIVGREETGRECRACCARRVQPQDFYQTFSVLSRREHSQQH